MNSLNPTLKDFILFCIERRGTKWPAIYIEMANVAGQRMFRGLNYNQLREMGLSLAPSNFDQLTAQIRQATSQK